MSSGQFAPAGSDMSAAATIIPKSFCISGGGGSGAAARIAALCANTNTITASGGSGWVTGNNLTLTGGGAAVNATYRVIADGNGAIAGLEFSGNVDNNRGYGYTSVPTGSATSISLITVNDGGALAGSGFIVTGRQHDANQIVIKSGSKIAPHIGTGQDTATLSVDVSIRSMNADAMKIEAGAIFAPAIGAGGADILRVKGNLTMESG